MTQSISGKMVWLVAFLVVLAIPFIANKSQLTNDNYNSYLSMSVVSRSQADQYSQALNEFALQANQAETDASTAALYMANNQ